MHQEEGIMEAPRGDDVFFRQEIKRPHGHKVLETYQNYVRLGSVVIMTLVCGKDTKTAQRL